MKWGDCALLNANVIIAAEVAAAQFVVASIR